jgi:pimeloyl-ACP methyl ester carboxylesterase
MTTMPEALPDAVLPDGVRARVVAEVNGLDVHVLEVGDAESPLVLLLHGFPELAYSWREVMVPIASAGFHVVAPDQRGYGRTTGWEHGDDVDLEPYRMPSLAADATALVAALGHREVAAVVGHDFGSPVAGWCALLRPDVFRSVVLMSAPFTGAPPPAATDRSATRLDVPAMLAGLTPPRQHYQWYFSSPDADRDLRSCPQGVHDFLRAYVHMKSGDWPGNRPHPLAGWTGAELGRLPRYYVMDLGATMPDTVAPAMPSTAEIEQCTWLPDDALRVFSAEFERTGFQGGLNWYRAALDPASHVASRTWAGCTVDVPATFLAGSADWGVHQSPGAFDRMANGVCTSFRDARLIDGAGHWVQQERPAEVAAAILDHLDGVGVR